MYMSSLHDGDQRAKCERCNKYFVLHAHTEGEARKYCFTCRLALQLSGVLPVIVPAAPDDTTPSKRRLNR